MVSRVRQAASPSLDTLTGACIEMGEAHAAEAPGSDCFLSQHEHRAAFAARPGAARAGHEAPVEPGGTAAVPAQAAWTMQQHNSSSPLISTCNALARRGAELSSAVLWPGDVFMSRLGNSSSPSPVSGCLWSIRGLVNRRKYTAEAGWRPRITQLDTPCPGWFRCSVEGG